MCYGNWYADILLFIFAGFFFKLNDLIWTYFIAPIEIFELGANSVISFWISREHLELNFMHII